MKKFGLLCLTLSALLLSSCVALSRVNDYEEHARAMAGAEEIHMADTESINNVNGQLPDKVYIKTATQTFNKDYQFCLAEGRIFYKSRTGAKGPSEWEPLETGLPGSRTACCQHWIQYKDGALRNRLRKLAVIFHRLVGNLVPVQTDMAYLGCRSKGQEL